MRNGSIITPGSSAAGQDSTSITDTNGNQITKGTGGSFTDTVGTDALTISGSSPITFTYPVANQSNGATTASATLNYKSYTVRTNFGCNVVEYGSNTVNLLDHVTLADGSSYTFTYEGTPGASDGAVTGRLASLTLPTGGTISYSYSGGCSSSGAGINADGTVGSLTRTTTDGTRTYTRATRYGNGTSTTLQDEKGNQSVIQFTSLSGLFYETRRQVFQGSASGTPLLERFTCYNGATPPCDGQALSSNTITEADVTTSYNGGSQDLVKNGYDTSGNLLSSAHYNGSALLQTTTNGYNSLSELTRTAQSDASGTNYTYASYGYDETAVTATSGLPQHTTPGSTPGNLTSAHVSAGAQILTSTTAYYDTGQPVSTTAADGGVTRYGYDSTGTFATGMTLPTPSSGVSMSTSASYDIASGSLLSSSGVNSGQTTTVNTYDALLRPKQVTLPTGGQANLNYIGANYQNVSMALGSGSTAQQEVLLDSYGRVSRQTAYNGIADISHNWYQADTCYDATGLVSFVPTRYAGSGLAGANATKVCSGSGVTYTYDALGRVTSVKTDDGTATTTYQNRAVLSSDVNGVQRVTQHDLLGRISGVCEISGTTLSGASPTPCGMDISGTGFVTSYSYDQLNHITTIGQGSQSRVFQTDPAGRPISSQEPERGTTGYSYSYNSVGLQVVRARPQANQTNPSTLTHTTTQYDTLGRVVSVGYDDGRTPNKNLYYDQPAAGLGWTQSPTNPKGNLVAITSGSGSLLARSQFSYDAVGEETTVWQCAPSICGTGNQESRDPEQSRYDYAGNLINSDDVLSGSISYTRSPAGELTSMTQNSYTDIPNTPNLVSGVTNGPFGPGSYTLGNGLGTAKTYDSMGRNNGVWVCAGSTSPYCNNATQLYGNLTSYSGARATGMCDTTLNQCQGQGYDEFNRLTVVSGANSSYSYSYDRYGNRLAQTPLSSTSGPAPSYNFNNANQIAGLPYDAAGNLMGDGISHSFTYDAEGNVVSVDNGSTATTSTTP